MLPARSGGDEFSGRVHLDVEVAAEGGGVDPPAAAIGHYGKRLGLARVCGFDGDNVAGPAVAQPDGRGPAHRRVHISV